MFFCVIMRKHLKKKVCFLNFKELNLHVYIISTHPSETNAASSHHYESALTRQPQSVWLRL